MIRRLRVTARKTSQRSAECQESSIGGATGSAISRTNRSIMKARWMSTGSRSGVVAPEGKVFLDCAHKVLLQIKYRTLRNNLSIAKYNKYMIKVLKFNRGLSKGLQMVKMRLPRVMLS